MNPAPGRGLPILYGALGCACALAAAAAASAQLRSPLQGPVAVVARDVVASQGLSVTDQAAIFAQAAGIARQISPGSVIAIVDRDGRELLVRAADGTRNFSQADEAIAVSKAGTAVFLSSTGEALTSRTAGFIVQQHYPPGIGNTPPGPLVGVEFSSMAFLGHQLLPPA